MLTSKDESPKSPRIQVEYTVENELQVDRKISFLTESELSRTGTVQRVDTNFLTTIPTDLSASEVMQVTLNPEVDPAFFK